MVDEDIPGPIPTQSFRVPTEDQNLYSSREMRVSPFVAKLPKTIRQFWEYFGFLPHLGLTLGCITIILPNPNSLGCSSGVGSVAAMAATLFRPKKMADAVQTANSK